MTKHIDYITGHSKLATLHPAAYREYDTSRQTVERVFLALLELDDPAIPISQLAEKVSLSERPVQKAIALLRDQEVGEVDYSKKHYKRGSRFIHRFFFPRYERWARNSSPTPLYITEDNPIHSKKENQTETDNQGTINTGNIGVSQLGVSQIPTSSADTVSESHPIDKEYDGIRLGDSFPGRAQSTQAEGRQTPGDGPLGTNPSRQADAGEGDMRSHGFVHTLRHRLPEQPQADRQRPRGLEANAGSGSLRGMPDASDGERLPMPYVPGPRLCCGGLVIGRCSRCAR